MHLLWRPGAGKTLISIMLIKEKAKGLLRDKTFLEGRRLTIFLAPKVALVWQVRRRGRVLKGAPSHHNGGSTTLEGPCDARPPTVREATV